ncbi:MAG: COX15/CtaA family protein, partial [Candidatus Rokubacteria bacterium]|nr:COX15/CtaA family protein [Candidatus Rokubacteria bacterium]
MLILAQALALVTLAATFALILLGGLVTNTGAALAVPDWPTTYGYNMFLYPWSRMIGGIFYEHSHRLVGAVVGVLTVTLAASLWRAGGRLRGLGVVAVAAVAVQGLLGGLRVVLQKDTVAIVHGCLAQAFFALLVVIALSTSRAAARPAAAVAPATRAMALAAVALVYAQIVLGALLT